MATKIQSKTSIDQIYVQAGVILAIQCPI